MKIVLVGAGSAQFGFGMLGDLLGCPALRGSEIALVDIDGLALARVASTATAFAAERTLPFRITGPALHRQGPQFASLVGPDAFSSDTGEIPPAADHGGQPPQ